MYVPPAAAAAPGSHEALALALQVAQQLARLVVEDLGAGRDPQHEVLAAAAVHVLVGAVLARRGAVLAAVAKVEQGAQALVDLQHDAAAVAAVAARGAALGHELLAAEGDRAFATVARADPDVGLVDEGGQAAAVRLSRRRRQRRQRTWRRADVAGCGATGSMLTVWRPRDSTKRTVPSTSANRVKSRPMPTLTPG